MFPRTSMTSLLLSAAPLLSEAALGDPAGAGTAGRPPSTAAKPKAEAEKVTMEDGREVEFVGKRKLLKEAILVEGQPPAVRFDFRNGKTRLFIVPAILLAQFAAHGASQKIGDETAGEDDVDDMVLAVDDLVERLNTGEWSAKREGGGFGGVSILMKALIEHSGKSEEQVRAWLKEKTHAEKMALRAHPPVKVIVDRLEAEKAAKAAGTSKVDAGALLGQLA